MGTGFPFSDGVSKIVACQTNLRLQVAMAQKLLPELFSLPGAELLVELLSAFEVEVRESECAVRTCVCGGECVCAYGSTSRIAVT